MTAPAVRPGTLLLAIAAVVVLGAGIGLRDPWPADEPRFSLIAMEMLRTGEFWIPRRGAELYPDKPPIFIWLTAAAIASTGSVRFGFLLPSFAAGLGTLALLFDLVRRLYGRRTAVLSGFAMLSTVLFTLQAKTAQIDMVLTFLTTLSAYGLLRHALTGSSPAWWLTGWAAAGFGILTKGVGFLPLLMLPCWFWMARRGVVPALRARDLALGFATLLAALATWGLPMIVMTTLGADPQLAAYRDDILFRQTGTRYVSAWHHANPWYFYLVEVLPWAWLPPVLLLPWAVPAWWRRIRRADARIVLPLSGVVLIVLFFSLSPGKRGVYILPTVPLLVLALAPLLAGLLPRPGVRRAAAWTLAILGGSLLVIGAAGLADVAAIERIEQRYRVAPWAWLAGLGTLAALLLATLGTRRSVAALQIWFAACWLAYSTLGYRQLDAVRSPRAMMERVATVTGSDAWLALPDFDEEFLLQARQPSVHFGRGTDTASQFARAFHWLQQAPRARWMLIEQRFAGLLACADLTAARDLGYQNRDEWWLLPGTAFTGCSGDETAAPLFIAPTTTVEERTS